MKQFHPKMVAIRNPALVAELKEAIKDVYPQPEILTGEEGTIEVHIFLIRLPAVLSPHTLLDRWHGMRRR